MITPLRLGIFLLLALCGSCQDRQPKGDPRRDVAATTPSPAPSPTGSKAAASVMRPSVLEEVEQPAAPPVPRTETLVIHFPERRIALGEQERQLLARRLQEQPVAGIESVIVRGHSDSRGSDEQNRKASLRRAEAVRDALLALGIAPERIEVIALGEARPVAPNARADGSDSPEGRARNRRVEVTFLVRPPEAAAPVEAPPQPAGTTPSKTS